MNQTPPGRAAKLDPATRGTVRGALLSPTPPPFIRPTRKTGRKRQGVTYEQKVHREMERRFGNAYLPSPWFTYLRGDHVRRSWCQPDALLFNLRACRIVIVEVKYQHTPDAYWQLMDLYLPVLESWLADAPGPWQLELLEVVKWYDPHAPFPAEVALCADPARPSAGTFNVHIWNPRRPRGNKAPPRIRQSEKLRTAK